MQKKVIGLILKLNVFNTGTSNRLQDRAVREMHCSETGYKENLKWLRYVRFAEKVRKPEIMFLTLIIRPDVVGCRI